METTHAIIKKGRKNNIKEWRGQSLSWVLRTEDDRSQWIIIIPNDAWASRDCSQLVLNEMSNKINKQKRMTNTNFFAAFLDICRIDSRLGL